MRFLISRFLRDGHESLCVTRASWLVADWSPHFGVSAMPAGSESTDKFQSPAVPTVKAHFSNPPKETIRFKKSAKAGQGSSGDPDSLQDVSLGPPGLTPQPKVKSHLCFPESSKVTCPVGAQCQYCHDFCCRSSQDHVSHRCAQHVNW